MRSVRSPQTDLDRAGLSRIFGLLKNRPMPVYSSGEGTILAPPSWMAARKTRGQARPLEQWEVTIPEHHERYITWDQFMRNQQQIRSNAGWNAGTGGANGAVRNGTAWLTGPLRCGRCGRALQVCSTRSKHHGPLPRYRGQVEAGR